MLEIHSDCDLGVEPGEGESLAGMEPGRGKEADRGSGSGTSTLSQARGRGPKIPSDLSGPLAPFLHPEPYAKISCVLIFKL